jgi:hypothetical protein
MALLLGLSGVAGVGKDCAALGLKEPPYRFQRLAFADPLKTMAIEINPIVSPDEYTDPIECIHLEDLVKVAGWDKAKRDPEVRRLLQELGLAARKNLGEDVWVNAALGGVHQDGRYVFTDVRYPNEAQAIHDFGGIVVRIERPGVGPVNGHQSENAMDARDFDAVIVNDGTRLDLWSKVQDLVRARFKLQSV